jgi:hypothetical protein
LEFVHFQSVRVYMNGRRACAPTIA